jgi:4-hydroxy-tetrahydrodipicolinate reductase
MVRIVVSGALGRIGKRIIECAEHDPGIEIAGMLEKKADPGRGIVAKLDDVTGPYDCLIEFTTPQATIEHVRAARQKRCAVVIGTTGLSAEDADIVRDASQEIPIVYSPNMSVGVNVFFDLIRRAASTLGKEYGVHVREAHHIHKKDKPSGTAKLMARIVKESRGAGEIPVESIREGEIVGDHDIVFESGVDSVRISHSAKTRDIFVFGALKAAHFVVTQKKGLFSMARVLGLEQEG